MAICPSSVKLNPDMLIYDTYDIRPWIREVGSVTNAWKDRQITQGDT